MLPAAAATTNVPPAAATNTVTAADAEAQQRLEVYDDVAVLTEALMLIRRNYVEETPYRKIVYGAVHGMLANLDPHSDFLEPTEFDGLREETEAQFGGIGIHIGMQAGFPLVIAPIEDSPAYKAGLQSGDRIVAIEGRPTTGTSMGETMKSLRGEPGSAVVITVAREDQDPFDVTIIRDRIKVATVKGTRVLRDGVGYVRVTQFSEPTAEAFDKALDDLMSKSVRGIVLDLRDNPGGLLDQAVEVVQRLLPPKSVVVTTRGREGRKPRDIYRADGRRHITDLPMAVLINRGSASASEIVTGALQDHRRAVVIGERSFGKASVQNILRLRTRPECAVKITTAHYYTPNGRLIHNKGIDPDIVVTVPPSAWRRAQLKRLYEEQPEAYPAAKREKVEDATDAALERAIDIVVGLNVYGVRPEGMAAK